MVPRLACDIVASHHNQLYIIEAGSDAARVSIGAEGSMVAVDDVHGTELISSW
jgi:hypothetical protein